jgi:hypothetical protein
MQLRWGKNLKQSTKDTKSTKKQVGNILMQRNQSMMLCLKCIRIILERHVLYFRDFRVFRGQFLFLSGIRNIQRLTRNISSRSFRNRCPRGVGAMR